MKNVIRMPHVPAILALAAALGLAGTGRGARAVLAAQAGGQTGRGAAQSVDQGLRDRALEGAIDVHAHADPDSADPNPRPIDIIELARMAKARGMRGFVIKQHYDQTAQLAYIARKEVPGIEVFGGIVLNLTVGGMNPAAVEHMAKVIGGWGRIVWMPTADTEDAARRAKQSRPFVAVTRNGEVLPETKAVLAVIAKTKTRDSNGELVLATGHLPPEEALLVIREAQNQGVKHIVVTHPRAAWTLPQMQDAAKLGAFLEFDAQTLVRESTAAGDGRGAGGADAIRRLGVEHCVLSTDLGQTGNPLHPDGLVLAARWLRSQGFTDQELDRLMKENPAQLLGLPPR